MFATLLLLVGTPHAFGAALLDADFTASLCNGWNGSTLPDALGRSGSGWIDSAGSQGQQVIVVGRRDCTDWTRVQLVIEADAQGRATCQAGGTYAGGDYQWKFEPTTPQWADFSDGFGPLQMPGLMSGFVGPYPTAANNIGNFEVFFALAGSIALEDRVSWSCTGADAAKVDKEVAGIDRGDMNRILGR